MKLEISRKIPPLPCNFMPLPSRLTPLAWKYPPLTWKFPVPSALPLKLPYDFHVNFRYFHGSEQSFHGIVNYARGSFHPIQMEASV